MIIHEQCKCPECARGAMVKAFLDNHRHEIPMNEVSDAIDRYEAAIRADVRIQAEAADSLQYQRPERTVDDAPAHYTNPEAHAWLAGWLAAQE